MFTYGLNDEDDTETDLKLQAFEEKMKRAEAIKLDRLYRNLQRVNQHHDQISLKKH